MSEAAAHRGLAWGVIAVGAATFVVLWYVAAPYGRHRREGWGPQMPTRAAWVVMESPAVFVFAAIHALGDGATAVAALVLLAMWQLHYLYRTFVFPFRMPPSPGGTPVAVVAMGFFFNGVNAYLNARQVSHFDARSASWLADPRFLGGAVIFFVGRQINLSADRTLLALKRAGKGYQIPRGPLFRRISCPNYLGEIVQWCGWAVATWSLAGLAFALFTFANLAPRARAHHRFYRERFVDYPSERKALIPGLW